MPDLWMPTVTVGRHWQREDAAFWGQIGDPRNWSFFESGRDRSGPNRRIMQATFRYQLEGAYWVTVMNASASVPVLKRRNEIQAELIRRIMYRWAEKHKEARVSVQLDLEASRRRLHQHFDLEVAHA